jgi:hypothetical protein
MLVQDTLTGYLHEVPDSQLYEPEYAEYPETVGEVVYDGFGNPVGLPFLAPIAAALAPAAAKALPGVVKGLTGSLRRFLPFGRRIQRALPRAMPGAIQQFAPATQAFQQPPLGEMEPPMPEPGGEAESTEDPYPGPAAPLMQPPPPGWIPRPYPYPYPYAYPYPYTRLRPRRAYGRWPAWRRLRGRVFARAAQTLPTVVAPRVTAAAVQRARMMQQARLRRITRARRIGGRRR